MEKKEEEKYMSVHDHDTVTDGILSHIELKSLSLDCDKMTHDCEIIHMMRSHDCIT